MVTVLLLLAVAAFITTIASATGHCPLFVPVLLISLGMLLQHIPLGK